jgi:hypothetical protein
MSKPILKLTQAERALLEKASLLLERIDDQKVPQGASREAQGCRESAFEARSHIGRMLRLGDLAA